MNNVEYLKNSVRTLPNLGDRYKEWFIVNNTGSGRSIDAFAELSLKLNLAHMNLGVGSELGELVNCTGTELKVRIDKTNLKEELGDIYWYVSNYCYLRNITPPVGEIVNDLPEDKCFELLLHSVGELLNNTKRYIAYNAELILSKEMEIIYNIYSAINLFEKVYGLDGDEIRKLNIHKLKVRYPDKFTEEAAVNRDTNLERSVLEGN